MYMYIGEVLEELNLISIQHVKNKGVQFCAVMNILVLIIFFSFADISFFSAGPITNQYRKMFGTLQRHSYTTTEFTSRYKDYNYYCKENLKA